MAKIPKVTEEVRVWEQMPWDTDTSYMYFVTYYFPQQPPRNLNRAYREAKPLKQKPKGGDFRSAPSGWRRWSHGRNSKDKRKKYTIVYNDGREETLPVPTWEERARAWDQFVYRQKVKELEQTKAKQLEQMEQMLRVAFIKLFQAWNQYTPQGENVGTLTVATQRLLQEMDAVFGGIRPDPDASQPADDLLPDEEGSDLTDLDRVDAIASLLDKVRRRRDSEPT